MSNEPTTRDTNSQQPEGTPRAATSQAALKARIIAKRRACKPTVTIQSDGTVLAGGCKLGCVESGPAGPVLVREDRCRSRSSARGTKTVKVNLTELLDAATEAVDKATGEGSE